MLKRRKTKEIKIGSVKIGGNSPVAIQSMVKTKTSNVKACLLQIHRLEKSGCEIVRLAVKDSDDAAAISQIKKETSLPLVADIHFHWQLAMESIENGADKIRLNPGNISGKAKIKEIAAAARLAGIPIRVGLNSGSVGGTGSIPGRMVKAASAYISILESFNFRDIVVSLKASSITQTLEAYRKMASVCDYPLHLGLTATGAPGQGTVKSAIVLGALLLEGIGDTIRVSLTDDPCREVEAARHILQSLGLRKFTPEIISCPTCGRCEVDLVKAVSRLQAAFEQIKWTPEQNIKKVAVMGCVVNGPGEAREADIGVAFGKKDGILFKKGKATGKIPFARCVHALLEGIKPKC